MIFGFELSVIFVMLIFNAIFASYEMAIASISKTRIAYLVSERKKGALDASYMKDRMEASLAVVQVGITLVGALAAATGGAGVGEIVSPILQERLGLGPAISDLLSVVFLIIPLSIVTILFGELVPKVFALNNKEWVVLKLSPVMRLLAGVIAPFVFIIEKFTKNILGYGVKKWNFKESDSKQGLYELMAAASLARSSRILGAREEKIVLSAAHLASRPVKEILIPAHDISTLNMNDSLMDSFLKAHMDMHTRFPVVQAEGDPQTISGYVSFKDIILAVKNNPSDQTVKSILRPMSRVDEDMPLSQLLEKMMQEKTHILLVVSKDDKVKGLVTLEDIIEELVGDIEDEFDRPLTHIQSYGSAWIMGGGVSINTLATTLGIPVPESMKVSGVNTLQDWCSKKMGGMPKGGEIIEGDGIFVVPRKFRRKRLAEAVVGRVEGKE